MKANIRLSQAARKLNVGTSSIIDFLVKNGFDIENKPNAKITPEQYKLLEKEFSESANIKQEASEVEIGEKFQETKQKINIKPIKSYKSEAPILAGIKSMGKIDIEKEHKKKIEKPEPIKKDNEIEILTNNEIKKEIIKDKNEIEKKKQTRNEITKPEKFEAEIEDLKGLTVIGKMELPKKSEYKPKVQKNESKSEFMQVASSDKKGGIRKRINKKRINTKEKPKVISEKEIQEHIKSTLAKLSLKNTRSDRSKYKKEKKLAIAEAKEKKLLAEQKNKNIIHVSEYVSANDLASIMGVTLDKVLAKCLELGMFVSINQRLDLETIQIIAEEFGFEVKFKKVEEDKEEEIKDKEEDLIERPPIVTIMGHVDHGKTSLLDYIKKTDVTKTEAGGITQHIGAYDVLTKSNKRITFLDTPGHEAFTAMRSRGTQITDIVVIVVAADDDVMPQTTEAINHALLANVPIIIAINKIDKPQANSEKIKEELSKKNILVEEWGGKYQSQEISAKTGAGINELLEKILLESELLELKANPNRKASGVVIEASLDQGRGYLATLMVQSGTLNHGDIVLAGSFYGKIKAMFDYHHEKIKSAAPSKPVQILGLNGAPQSGDKFRIMNSDKEAKEISLKRQQILREQLARTQRHITLEEVGQRLKIGNFQELKLIIKGDVDGSVEALADSLLKLSSENIKIVVIHKGVGAITDSDILLAAASDAIIIGFQIRPTSSARKLAEKENIDIRLYSIIYEAINHVKDAIEGMKIPESKEIVTGNAEVRELFKVSKVGTIAGCYLTEGLIKKKSDIRLIRDGIIIYTGKIKQMKRLKEDINESRSGFECGISIENFNDIKVGDNIEAFEMTLD